MAEYIPDANTAMGVLQQGFTSINGFGSMVSSAYAVPGADYIAPLFILVMLAVATYVKAQNVPVTATAIVLSIAVWDSVFMGSSATATLVHMLMGLAVVGIAYLFVRKVMTHE